MLQSDCRSHRQGFIQGERWGSCRGMHLAPRNLPQEDGIAVSAIFSKARVLPSASRSPSQPLHSVTGG